MIFDTSVGGRSVNLSTRPPFSSKTSGSSTLEVEVGVVRILFPRSKRNINSPSRGVNAETITPATERGWNFIRSAEVRRDLAGNIEDGRPLGILIGCASLRRFRARGGNFLRLLGIEGKKEKMERLEILKRGEKESKERILSRIRSAAVHRASLCSLDHLNYASPRARSRQPKLNPVKARKL